MDGSKTYGDTVEDAFQENIIFGKRFEDFGIDGDVDEDCKSRVCDWLWNTLSDHERFMGREF